MYGENSGRLRDALAALLGEYRVNYQVLRDVSRTGSARSIEVRQSEAAAQVRRYRQTILMWCHQTLVQADPNPIPANARENFTPPEWLRRSLQRILAENPEPLPTTAELATRQEVQILESWRQAAKATVLAERDFDRGLSDGLLDHREWVTLAGDVADVTKALLILDRRYKHLPGWQTLHGIRHLSRYIDECSVYAHTVYGRPDYNIDWRGWHPPDPEIAADADSITHVLAAEHRLLNSLKSVPSMVNLRHLLMSQREVSHLAADRAREIAPEQSARFRTREQTYAKLLRASRGAAGLAGTGAIATGHSAHVARLLMTIRVGEPISVEAFRNLDKLFRHVDNALCAAIEQGFNTRLYLVRRTLPRIDPTDGRSTHRAREIYDPVERDVRTPLIAVARRRLRTEPPHTAAPGNASFSRTDFRAAINRRRGRTDGLTT